MIWAYHEKRGYSTYNMMMMIIIMMIIIMMIIIIMILIIIIIIVPFVSVFYCNCPILFTPTNVMSSVIVLSSNFRPPLCSTAFRIG